MVGARALRLSAVQMYVSCDLVRNSGSTFRNLSLLIMNFGCNWYFSAVMEQQNCGLENIGCGIADPDFTGDVTLDFAFEGK